MPRAADELKENKGKGYTFILPIEIIRCLSSSFSRIYILLSFNVVTYIRTRAIFHPRKMQIYSDYIVTKFPTNLSTTER